MNYGKISFVSVISYVFSNNIGFSSFSGSAVRFRFYSSLGLSTEEIVKIITFCLFTFWIGLFISAGVAFVIEPISIPKILKLLFFFKFSLHFGFFLLQL